MNKSISNYSLDRQSKLLKKEIIKKISKVIDHSQYINGPENVITESTSSYMVESNTNSAYNWFISGLGTINSGQGSNSIEIQWSNIEGISTLCVVEKVDCASEISCFGDTTCFEILVQKPTIIIEQFDYSKSNFIKILDTLICVPVSFISLRTSNISSSPVF